MPNKFVFPGGAVDAEDANIPLHRGIDALCAERLGEEADPTLFIPLRGGHSRAVGGNGPDPRNQRGMERRGTRGLGHICRSGIYPRCKCAEIRVPCHHAPGRPRRFDARFFMIDANAIASDLDDFSAACDELSHLSWIPLDEVRKFDLPFITEVVWPR